MTKLWQYVAWAHESDCKVWGSDVWLRDDPEGRAYHRQFPAGPRIFWRIASLFMALGFLHGDEGDTYAHSTWCWTFWRQVPGPNMYEKGWRHYNLPWSHPFRKLRRQGALRNLIGLHMYPSRKDS